MRAFIFLRLFFFLVLYILRCPYEVYTHPASSTVRVCRIRNCPLNLATNIRLRDARSDVVANCRTKSTRHLRVQDQPVPGRPGRTRIHTHVV
uniref:Putative secreted protein n=1 Tax=Ixodes ricinus TaxID=34613 RepID=A0A6B0U471_IXORI